MTRYIGLVYATALRRVDGDTHRAEDVTQIALADLLAPGIWQCGYGDGFAGGGFCDGTA